MPRSAQLCALAFVVTVADLAVFVYSVPVLFEAWGTNHLFLCLMFATICVWTQSLANLWRTGLRSIVEGSRTPDKRPLNPL
jgi:hypothetical protein